MHGGKQTLKWLAEAYLAGFIVGTLLTVFVSWVMS